MQNSNSRSVWRKTDLQVETTGGERLLRAVASVFRRFGIPATEDNVEDARQSFLLSMHESDCELDVTQVLSTREGRCRLLSVCRREIPRGKRLHEPLDRHDRVDEQVEDPLIEYQEDLPAALATLSDSELALLHWSVVEQLPGSEVAMRCQLTRRKAVAARRQALEKLQVAVLNVHASAIRRA